MLIHCTSSNATTETSRGTRSPCCRERDEDRLGQDVVRGEDRRRRGARADQVRRVLDRVLPVERAGLDQLLADRDAVLLEGALVAG